jgi:DHA3 family tetracycline resistance protein-like MFS transporter
MRRAPRLLQPLRWRSFSLLCAGSAVSMVGDGFFTVALAFAVYRLSNVPTALSIVTLTWTVPMILLLLFGGVVSDRYDRRRVMALADLARAAVIGVLGVLVMAGLARLWQFAALMPLYGAGTAFFSPASHALPPDILPEDDLAPANAFLGVLQPLAMRLAGPALGGVVVGLAGPGAAMLFDGASFLVSAASVLMIAAPPLRLRTASRPSMLREIGEGMRYVRGAAWCAAGLGGFSIGMLASFGPGQILLPYVVKNSLHAGPTGLGVILAAGGVGSIAAGVVSGQRGLPRRQVSVTFVVWALAFGAPAGFGLMHTVWQGMLVAALSNALLAYGLVIWFTMMQTRVPRDLLGRVSSLDWLVSSALSPISLALVGPLGAALGVRTVFIASGVLGAVGMAAPLLLAAVRADDAPASATVAARF